MIKYLNILLFSCSVWTILIQGIYINSVHTFVTIETDKNSTKPITQNYNIIDSIIDKRDGETYKIVKIGTQVWFVDNLKSTKYNDGTLIPVVAGVGTLWTLDTPAYCWYQNDSATYKDRFGALYNWFAVKTGKLCPLGWHVPTDLEWTILTDFLGGNNVAGAKLKSTSGWDSPNEVAANSTNESGFTALPGGCRNWLGNFLHSVDDLGSGYWGYGYWWSSTEFGIEPSSLANARSLRYNNSFVNRSFYGQGNGFSVRCIKNN
jgi:uncharacterized protein (TIGR02145 family)